MEEVIVACERAELEEESFELSDDDEAVDEEASAVESSEDEVRLPDGSLLVGDEWAVPLTRARSESEMAPPGNGESLLSKYGEPRSPGVVAELLPPGGGGLVWHASLVSDDWQNPKDVSPTGEVKPRRPTLPVRASDFFASLVLTPDGRWIFDGVLNGWPGLDVLELVSITVKVRPKLGPARIKRVWDAAGTAGVKPRYPSKFKSVRVTLRAAPWTSVGWAAGVPGHVWWFFATQPSPRLAHGEGMLAAAREQAAATGEAEPLATNVHIFAHRYAKRVESQKDKLTYHAAILLECDLHVISM